MGLFVLFFLIKVGNLVPSSLGMGRTLGTIAMGETVLVEGAWNFQSGQVRFIVWVVDNRSVYVLINVQPPQA